MAVVSQTALPSDVAVFFEILIAINEK